MLELIMLSKTAPSSLNSGTMTFPEKLNALKHLVIVCKPKTGKLDDVQYKIISTSLYIVLKHS